MKKLISIIIPAYNESEVVQKLCAELNKTLITLGKYQFEIIFVENGSTDKTLSILLEQRKKDKKIKIIELSKNVGWDEGIMVGLTYASGDAAIIMVADLQDDPALITSFLKRWEEGYDIVYTVIRKRVNGRFVMDVGIKIFNKIMDIFSNNLLPHNASEYSLLDKRVYKAILTLPEHNKFFRGMMHWVGFKKIAVYRKRQERAAGKSKTTLLNATKFAVVGITSFSYLPLRISFVLFFIFLIGGLISLFFSGILSLILFSFSLVFLNLGIIGEYLSKILDEGRKRPTYFVRQTYGT